MPPGCTFLRVHRRTVGVAYMILLTLLMETHEAEGIILTSSINPGGTLTINETPFNVSCNYQNQTGDTLYALAINRTGPSEVSFGFLITYDFSTQEVTYNEATLINRTTAVKPTSSSSALVLMFNYAVCSDAAEYQCYLSYNDGSVKSKSSISTVDSLKSKSNFRVDGLVSFTPTTNIKEGDEVFFTCSGDVGSEPTGQLAWYMYKYGTTSGGIDLSNQASSMVPVAVPNECTYNRTSKLTLTMTPDMNYVVIRCTAQQDMKDELGDGHNSYRQTRAIEVNYAPRYLVIKRNSIYKEGSESLELTCTADSNPNSTYHWLIQTESDPNVTKRLAGAMLTIRNFTLGDSGAYTCVATNIVNQQNMTTSKYMNIKFDEKPMKIMQNVEATATKPWLFLGTTIGTVIGVATIIFLLKLIGSKYKR